MTNEEILTYLSKPYDQYLDTNAMNFKNLFEKIKREQRISNKVFDARVKPVLIEEIERSFLEEHGDSDPFWGAWFKDEETEDMQWSSIRTTLSAGQRETLAKLMQREEASGEMIGYGLCVFAGLSVTEVMKARYMDISNLTQNPGISTLHTRGAFPKRSRATSYDSLPRVIPLPETVASILSRRRKKLETLHFPIETENAVYKDPGELPVACKGRDHTRFCHISELSAYARDILKCGLGFDETSISRLSNLLLKKPSLYANERSAAYWLGRLDCAWSLRMAGIEGNTLKYLMGWPEDDEEEHFRIAKVTEEELEKAHNLYEKRAAFCFA